MRQKTKSLPTIQPSTLKRLEKDKQKILADFNNLSVSKTEIARRYRTGFGPLESVISAWIGPGKWSSRPARKPKREDCSKKAIQLFNDISKSKRDICRELNTHPDTLSKLIDQLLGPGSWSDRPSRSGKKTRNKRVVAEDIQFSDAAHSASVLAALWKPTPYGLAAGRHVGRV